MNKFFAVWLLGACCVAGGCGDKGPCMVEFTNANDYSYTADLALESTPMASCSDGTIDWSQITTDYRGRPIDPTDVDHVTIAKIDKGQADLIDAIDTNGLKQADIITYSELDTTGQTSAALTDFSVIGNSFVPSDPSSQGFCADPNSSWLATIWVKDDRNILEILSSAFMVPTDGEPNTTLSFSDSTATLAFTVDLQSLTPLSAEPDCDAYGLDWSAVTNDVNGVKFESELADTLRIAHLPGDVTTAEAAFLTLDSAADQTYFYQSYGLTAIPDDAHPDADLSLAMSTDGKPFPGFTADGTWLVGLECTQLSCFSPAPLILGVVQVQ